MTDPFVGLERRRLSDSELAQAIRIDMAAELDAINLYQSHLESTDNPIAKQMIQHIMDEEKDHLAEFEQLLFILDSRQSASMAHAEQEMAEQGHPPVRVDAPVAEAAETTTSTTPVLTVGSLKGA